MVMLHDMQEKWNTEIHTDLRTDNLIKLTDVNSVSVVEFKKELHEWWLEDAFGLEQEYTDLVMDTLDNNFFIVPASLSHHHCHLMGLYKHSLSVTVRVVSEVFAASSWELDKDVYSALVVASILHDVGKTDCYSATTSPDGVLSFSSHPTRTLVGHVVKSYERFVETTNRHDFPSEWKENVGHMILSHHGFLEWGSPVKPTNHLAWLLHRADAYDCEIDKIDNGMTRNFMAEKGNKNE